MPNESHIATPDDWRAASRTSREAHAEPLHLPSGAVILAAKPEPLAWILSGRVPQRLLAVALQGDAQGSTNAPKEISREEILDLARFATELVRASVVQPRIGEKPGEISLDDIPVEDRAFIFDWACRSLGEAAETSSPATSRGSAGSAATGPNPRQEDLSSVKLERFRQK